MADLFQEFVAAVKSGQRWKEAFDLCNGMDMFGMLRALNALGKPLLHEFKVRIPVYTVWGGPNMPRIAFAIDVVQTRIIPLPPADLPPDQVDAAKLFLSQTVSVGGPHASEALKTMRDWASSYSAGAPTYNRYLFDDAVPYLWLSAKGQPKMRELSDRCVGSKLGNVYGLAVHCTAGPVGPSAYGVAINRCVDTWNTNNASAHFAISADGTIIQFIPTNFIANAQHKGNTNWVSVEIDNNGLAPMLLPQLESVKRLFTWVCITFGVPRTVATGLLFDSLGHNDLIRSVCAAGDASVTRSVSEALSSHGLSCHRWLDPIKPCPGPGIMSQMPSIVKAGAVS